MNGICDEIKCNSKAKYRIGELNIELCEKHFNGKKEPTISLFKTAKTELSRLEKRIIDTLESNGRNATITTLKLSVTIYEPLFNKTLEDLIVKEIVMIH